MRINFGNEKVKGSQVVAITLKCDKCGRVWGIRCEDEKYLTIEDMPYEKFVCMSCLEKKIRANNNIF